MNGSREPQLAGQTIVVLGGTSGMGFETAKQARSEGAKVVITGRDPERVERAARELGADTTLSASLLGDRLDARREQLRTTLPIRRVVGPDDIAALAIHLMVNTAITGATYDIDGGQQLVEE
jgi:NAD(P)-dependent dehydrogenase (short-subunit alcohol dehydrogenase family)